MEITSKEQYENILYNPNIQIVEKITWLREMRVVKLISNGIVLARRHTDSNGSVYLIKN